MWERVQFGISASVHFLFVPLTIGLSFFLCVLHYAHLKTKNDIYKQFAYFFASIFSLHFAMGVATGMPLQFQLSSHFSPYLQYVSKIFGHILALEGMSAFFVESALIGIYYLGFSKKQRFISGKSHFWIAVFICIATHLSGFWILSANAWMQHPVGASFLQNGCELVAFHEIYQNPMFIFKFIHTMLSGHLCGVIFVMFIGCCLYKKYMKTPFFLKNANDSNAHPLIQVIPNILLKKSAFWGMICMAGIFLSGHMQALLVLKHQPLKHACMEGILKKSSPPYDFILFSYVDANRLEHRYSLTIPYLLSIFHLSWAPMKSVEELQETYTSYMNGIYPPSDTRYGYTLLKKRYPSMKEATPNINALFYAFRVMVGCGLLITGYLLFMYLWIKRNKKITKKHITVGKWMLPVPWIATLSGWFLTEHGRQPWVIYERLPTFLGTSIQSQGAIKGYFWISLLFYLVLITFAITTTRFLIKRGIYKSS